MTHPFHEPIVIDFIPDAYPIRSLRVFLQSPRN